MDLGDDDDDEEDEEMLQLKLQAIQAKLKLKKLQSARAKKADATRSESAPIPDIPTAGRNQPREPQRSALAARSQSQAEVQVPASPVKRAQTAQGDHSPSRVRLGIDKGIKAKDISLKRAPSFKRPADVQNGSHGGYLRRAHTPALGNTEQTSQQQRPLTFSERLVAARSEETSLQERRERIKQVRSNAFELGKQEIEQMKSNAKEIPNVPLQPTQYSRDEVVAGGQIKRNSSLRRPTQDGSRPESDLSGAGESQKEKISPSEVPEEDAAGFEPYSSTHLSKRIIPHSDLTRNLSGKKTYVIKDLLKHVKAPNFELPEIEQDIVVFGILASKSDPRTHKTNGNLKEKVETDPARGKYMVLQLVDLQWELELFLFNSGFERFWKLTPGTLLAILNPTIMPPPPNRTDTGKFSLVINSGLDTILEVGTARDLGYCKSVKKDGQCCNGWVNKKRTEFCEFHMNLGLAKHRAARQDVNAFNTGMGPRKDDGNPFNKRGGGSGGYNKNSHRWDDDPKKKGRGNYDRGAQGQWFISKPSAASMLDNEVLGGGQVAGTIEKSETLRRRLATEEKERELMKSLGKMGSGAGKEYMRRGGNATASRGAGLDMQSARDEERVDRDARSLGLLATKGSEPKMHLSPVKRKRTEGSFSTSTATSSHAGGGGTKREAFGWGGGLQDKLARMKGGEKLRPTGSVADSFEGNSSNAGGDDGSSRARSPARKKTRFITEKGIREAGRESLGTELTTGAGDSKGKARRGMVVLDDDEDELEILR